jgi:hypothetical protein
VEDAFDLSLCKMDELIKRLTASWLTHYECQGKELALDESVIKFFGRCSIKQYQIGKPDKSVLMMISLCESCSGYCLNTELFKGPSGTYPSTTNNINTVHRLLKPLAHCDHVKITDSAYTSTSTFTLMRDKLGLQAYGSMVSRRKGTPDVIRVAVDCTLPKKTL